MKSFENIRNGDTGLNEASASYSDVRKWVFDKLENTEMHSGEMRAAFKKKFGDENIKMFERAVSEYMD